MSRVWLASGTRYDIGPDQVIWTQDEIDNAGVLLRVDAVTHRYSWSTPERAHWNALQVADALVRIAGDVLTDAQALRQKAGGK